VFGTTCSNHLTIISQCFVFSDTKSKSSLGGMSCGAHCRHRILRQALAAGGSTGSSGRRRSGGGRQPQDKPTSGDHTITS